MSQIYLRRSFGKLFVIRVTGNNNARMNGVMIICSTDWLLKVKKAELI